MLCSFPVIVFTLILHLHINKTEKEKEFYLLEDLGVSSWIGYVSVSLNLHPHHSLQFQN